MKNLNYYLTPKEHALFGSTMEGRYTNNPYTPIAIQDKEISIDECDKIRQDAGFSLISSSTYWGEKYLEGKMSLEKLTKEGDTVQDPALIEVSTFYEKIKDLSSKFPYARENHPRVELENE